MPAAVVTMSPLFEIDNEARTHHPNIRTDAMFPPKAFDALVEMVEAAAERKSSTASPKRSTSRSTTSSPVCRAR